MNKECVSIYVCLFKFLQKCLVLTAQVFHLVGGEYLVFQYLVSPSTYFILIDAIANGLVFIIFSLFIVRNTTRFCVENVDFLRFSIEMKLTTNSKVNYLCFFLRVL